MYAIIKSTKNQSFFISPDFIENIDFYSNIKDIVICPICNGIIFDPIQCEICEKNFCKNCLSKFNNDSKENPKCFSNCETPIFKENPKQTKNILDKLIFKCEKCNLNNINYENFIEHLKNCIEYDNNNNNKLIKCEICEKLITNDNNIKNKNIYKKLSEDLYNEYNNLLKEKYNLIEEINKIQKNKIVNEGNMKDKCKHFIGNYKPIFKCCNTPYPCYICHDDNENHKFIFSDKVLCLICGRIYEGEICPKCNIKQEYIKK